MTSSDNASRPVQVALAFGVHLYTAAGLLAALFTVIYVVGNDYRRAFLAMFVAVVIDATDGTFARALEVKRHVPWIDGRKLDDIVDFVNYTFVPILIVWHAGWLPEPSWLFCVFPLVTSSFAFVHEGAKQEDKGFFQGFPSYWNIVVFYIALWHGTMGPVRTAILVVALSFLSVAPVRFVYPNRAPRWRPLFLGGAAVWAVNLLAIVQVYPVVPSSWIRLSLVYPALYIMLSVYLDWQDRLAEGRANRR